MSMFPNSTVRPIDYSQPRDLTRFHFFNAVYSWMSVALAVTASVAFVISRSPAMLHFFAGSGLVVMLPLLLLSYLVAAGAQRMAINVGATAGVLMLLLYAAIIGALISFIFVIYPISTLAGAFFMTAGTFLALSIVGFVLKRDLSVFGSILTMAVVGLILASIVNLFFASNAFSWFLTYAILAVFICITVYQTQQLKMIAERFADDANMASRYAVVGSLMLYASFLNMFMSILRIMGGNGRR